MTVVAQTTRISDDARRLLDTVCQGLRAVQLEQIGELLQQKVFGTGRMLTQRGQAFELTPSGELMLRQILDACVRPRVTDAQRRADCLLAIRGAGFEL